MNDGENGDGKRETENRPRGEAVAKATYRDAGVDLEIYAQAMERLPSHLESTYTPRVMPLRNGFAGLFALDFPKPVCGDELGTGKTPAMVAAPSLFRRNYRDPVLVSCTDGVGTKLKVASQTERHDTVGIDLVAMSVNDALCLGAEPLFFLDYVAMPKDDPARLEEIVRGIAGACRECDMALLGGETAILPDMYAPDDYDLAGFCVGVVERDGILDGSAIMPGDVAIGIASSGLHSNGYSLARRCVFDIAGLSVTDVVAECGGRTVGELLLEPTRLYARAVRAVREPTDIAATVHGIAHITGGGLCENLSRIVPDGVRITLRRSSWTVPPVFTWLQQLGEVEQAEMDRVFNMGIGMVLVTAPDAVTAIRARLAPLGFDTFVIGSAAAGQHGVVFDE